MKSKELFLGFSVFLEHWQKYMGLRGKKNQFNLVYEKETHNAFDNSDDYALASMLRNYIAHSTELIRGKFWGGNTYDIGCSKEVLLKDKSFSKTKREIIGRQPAKFISLTSIMKGSLGKLEEIHQTFFPFDLGGEETQAAQVVKNAIIVLKDAGLENRYWHIVNTQKSFITTYTPDNKPIETVPATEVYSFAW